MLPASSSPAGAPVLEPPGPGLFPLCREIAAQWWSLSTASFVVLMGGVGLSTLARQLAHIEIVPPMRMATGPIALANDQGAVTLFAAAFVIGTLLSLVSVWEGTAPFVRRREE
jgi:hypothetical protein